MHNTINPCLYKSLLMMQQSCVINILLKSRITCTNVCKAYELLLIYLFISIIHQASIIPSQFSTLVTSILHFPLTFLKMWNSHNKLVEEEKTTSNAFIRGRSLLVTMTQGNTSSFRNRHLALLNTHSKLFVFLDCK